MEPGPRRRRTCRPPVSAFLRDPSSGRVYRRGKLIGEVVPRAGGAAGRLRPHGKVEREVALHSRLKHRNIVALHGHFADREHVYLVLEYCGRQSLAHVLEARRTLTEPEVRYYLRGLVSGLRYLHQRRIVHRDLKPSNFFLNKNMVVKIGDLGLAARAGPGGHCHRVLCGTPNFLAPEVIARNGHSCQSDIWALGCVMYTVLTGTPPFTGAPLSEMYQNIRDGHYPEPAHLSPNARRLIARLLAPDPAERPSLDHLLQDDFFTQGFTPDRLPAHSCHSAPLFTAPQPLGRLFRKVGRLLLTQCRPPRPVTPSEASGPVGGASDPDSVGCGREVSAQGRARGEAGDLGRGRSWGTRSSGEQRGDPHPPEASPGGQACFPSPRLLLPQASLLDRGALHPEVPVHLLTQGTLRSDPAGERTLHPRPFPGRGCWWGVREWRSGQPLGLARAGTPLRASTFPPVKWGRWPERFRVLNKMFPDSVVWGRAGGRGPSRWQQTGLPLQRSVSSGPKGRQKQEVEVAIRNLSLCLDRGLPATQEPPGEQRPTLWAPKWVDYFSKYGFGYHLSDGGSGVLLRDGTHMALRPPGDRVCYVPGRGKLETFAARDVPSPLGAKLAVLRLFTRCMQQRLREEGARPTPTPPAAPGLCLLRFLASERALLLLFSDGTLQISGSGDRTHLVLGGGSDELRLTVWEGSRPGAPDPPGALQSPSPALAARPLLVHALHMLRSV
ncbi:inactive serine/threonine-protein kinase PLK5 isoform X2 [Mustela erminea]|uniref:inactive serine/threonine-protein kinase PLK5 isoform X2 n=1 Tax=Mustela erminea TaxID=36723 RepID=UPI00138732FE|nr:inactive serine/threonine-protein kinase PLK5 isoform X2 [Mustela erminea]